MSAIVAKRLVAQTVASGKDILFVGTKRQARHAVQEESARCGMHYVSERWLGGTLTNFRTIRARLNRLDELGVGGCRVDAVAIDERIV